MGIPPKGSCVVKFFKDPFIYEVILALAAMAAAFLAAENLKEDAKIDKKWIILVAAAVCFLSVIKSSLSFIDRRKSKSTHELEGCLHALHSVLVGASKTTVRVTIYVPVKRFGGDEELEQIINYVGGVSKYKAGRRISCLTGVAGLAYRTGEMKVVERKSTDYESFVKELVGEWGFTDQQAREVNPATYSWLAMPLVQLINGKDRVDGVVFIDSQDKTFFTAEKKEIILYAAIGIARFIGIKYG